MFLQIVINFVAELVFVVVVVAVRDNIFGNVLRRVKSKKNRENFIFYFIF